MLAEPVRRCPVSDHCWCPRLEDCKWVWDDPPLPRNRGIVTARRYEDINAADRHVDRLYTRIAGLEAALRAIAAHSPGRPGRLPDMGDYQALKSVAFNALEALESDGSS